jgi:hypothetical protein
MADAYATIILIGPTFLYIWLLVRLRGTVLASLRLNWLDAFMGLVALAIVVISSRKFIKLARERRKARQGLEAEIMVAQHLMRLMSNGCLVFNDIPADRFNLDHVVIGPNAVFMVETKSKKKPAEKGSDNAKVYYDGKTLKFPDHIDTKSLDQARNEARWLSQYMAGAAGEAVKVVPVVALPGWWVEIEKAASGAEVLVTNAKNPNFMLSANFGPAISESLRTRIAHALVARYPESSD